MSLQILMVCDSPNDPWAEFVGDVLQDLGTVVIANQENINERLSLEEYSAIILDAASIANTPKVVSSLRSLLSDVPIVVATSSPTWKRAKESLRAGATDYIYETFNREELIASLARAFDRRLNSD